MEKRTIVLLVAIFLFFPSVAMSAPVDLLGCKSFVVSFGITVNGQDKGYMEIEVDDDRYRSQYYHISPDDRIPFYARNKSGVLDENLNATELSFNGARYRVYNDLMEHPPDDLPSFLQNVDSRQNRALLVNQSSGHIELIVDKIPIITFESIIIGFLSGHMQRAHGKHMMLYEGANNIIMKVFFEKEEVRNSRSCAVAKYRFFRESMPDSSPQLLFDILVNKNGVPIEVSSKSRWKFKLEKIGKYEIIEEYVEPFYVRAAEKKARVLFSDIDAIIERLEVGNIARTVGDIAHFDYAVHIRLMPDPDYEHEAIKYLQREVVQIEGSRQNKKILSESDNHYYIKAGEEEVCLVLKETNVSDDCISAKHAGSLKVSFEGLMEKIRNEKMSDDLHITSNSSFFLNDQYFIEDRKMGEEVGMSIKSACELYLAEKYPGKEIQYKDHSVISKQLEQDIDQGDSIQKGRVEPVEVEIRYILEETFSEADIRNAAKSAIAHKLYGHKIPMDILEQHDMPLVKQGDREFALAMPKKTVSLIVEDKRLEKYLKVKQQAGITSRQVLDKNGLFLMNGSSMINTGALEDTILNNLMRKHSSLRYRIEDIQKEESYWLFPIIDGGIDLCR